MARNAVPQRESTLAGRFVDVATGKAIVTHRDFALGTIAPLVFDRVWLSSSTYAGPLGHGWHHAYDVALGCRADSVAIRLSDGRVLWFRAPARGHESFDPVEHLRLSRDSYGYALRDTCGSELRFVPHRSQPACVLSSLRTLAGRELRFGYDHRARLVRITSRGDRDLELGYDRTDRVIAIQGPDVLNAGKRIVLVQYAYDARGNLRKASDALGQARRYAYERHLMTSAVDRNGCAAHFEWDGPDPRARCVHTWVDAGIRDRKLEYGARSTTVRNSFGHETTFDHDGSVVRRVADASGSVRELVYGEGGRVQREIDPLGQVLAREYDARGYLAKHRGSGGSTWSFEHEGSGRMLRAIDPLGGRWQFVHDARGQLLRCVDPLGRITRYHYRGRWLVGVTRPGDRHFRYAYDDAGNVESCTAPDETVTRYAYDAWSQVIAITAPHGQTQQRSYDVLGRLIRIRESDANPCELAYDAEGRVVRWKDRFREVKCTYQGTGQLSSRTEAGLTVCFEYDAEEQLVGIVNEDGKVFRIQRDASGQIVETTGFDGCKRRYARDALGRITRVERGAHCSEYDYDAAGRVIEVQHSDGAFEGFRHRADGALMGAWNQVSTVTYERDACGRVTREQHGDHFVVNRFDASGRRTSMECSFGPQPVFERDASGRLGRIVERSSGFEIRFEHDALGLVLERTLPGGGRCVWQRDALGRACVIRHEASVGAITREVCYEWDGIGRLRRRTDSRGGTAEYRYDARGNFAWRRGGDGSYQLRMPDRVGNLFGREDRRDREYGLAGQLLTRSGRSGEVLNRYDASGQLIERRDPGDSVWQFSWSASGVLSGVVRPDGSEVTFGYDALGRRIWKKHAGRTTRFFWDGDRLLHEWIEGERGRRESAITWLYEPDEAHPVAKLAADGAFAILTDHTGTPSQMFDRKGQQCWAAETTVAGELCVLEGTREACLLRGQGMYEDLETGLYCQYTGHTATRYYDPAAGSYLCQGALAAAPSFRAYGRSYAAGVEWATTSDDPNASTERFELERSRTPDAVDRMLVDRDSQLMPGSAYASHTWNPVLIASRDYASHASATDTPRWLVSEPESLRRCPLGGPNRKITERSHEFDPTKPAPLARPLLSR